MDAHRHPDPRRGQSQPVSRLASQPELQPRPRYPHPSKEDVRAYMERRKRTRQPPPAPAEIRRQLGWHSGAGIATAPAAPVPGAWGWLPAVFPAVLAELAAATLLAWCTACVPRAVPAEKIDRTIT